MMARAALYPFVHFWRIGTTPAASKTEEQRGTHGTEDAISQREIGSPLGERDIRAFLGQGPAHQQAGTERAVVAATGDGEIVSRRQWAVMPFARPFDLFAFELREILPDQGIEVNIHSEAGVGDAGNYSPGRILAGHCLQAAGGGAALREQEERGAQNRKDRGFVRYR